MNKAEQVEEWVFRQAAKPGVRGFLTQAAVLAAVGGFYLTGSLVFQITKAVARVVRRRKR